MARDGSLAGWQTDAERRIRALSQLAADWDGPDSPEVTPEAIEASVVLVARLAEHEDRLRVPAVTPTPFGGVFIEWDSETSNVAFTVHCGGGVQLNVDVSYTDENGACREGTSPFRQESLREWLPVLKKHRA